MNFNSDQGDGGPCAGDYGGPIMIPLRPRGSRTDPLEWVQLGIFDSILTNSDKCHGHATKLVYDR